MPRLSARVVSSLKEPGFYGDGDGLYLSVKSSGARSWILRTVVQGKRRDLGLGSAEFVSLAQAREKARELRKVARSGGDPYAERNRRKLTLEEAAIQYHASLARTFRSEKHARLWLRGLEIHAFPALGSRFLEDIGTADLRQVLDPIWVEKHDTAKRIKQRLAAILEWAKVEGHYHAENPAYGLKRALPPVRVRVRHMPALPWPELPAFMSDLASREGVSARTLEFIVLTACRSGEARHARWAEFKSDVWTIPADRTKTGREHRVPLAPPALRALDAVCGLDDEYVFPSQVRHPCGQARPMSDNVFRALYMRMQRDSVTTHGFRSTFRDWCSEAGNVSWEVAEVALAHARGGAVERAYARSDLLDLRRDVMLQWSAFATSPSAWTP